MQVQVLPRSLSFMPPNPKPTLVNVHREGLTDLPGRVGGTNFSESELLKLTNAQLRTLLKQLKIRGWLWASKPIMVREIISRTEQRERLREFYAR